MGSFVHGAHGVKFELAAQKWLHLGLTVLQIVSFVRDHPQLIDDGNSKKVCRVLDILVGKMMKAHDTNEVCIN